MGVAPSRSAYQIPDITKRARHVAGRIGAPAGHVQVQPTQVAAAGIGHRNGARSIGEKMSARRSDVGCLRHNGGAGRRYRLPHGSFFMGLADGRQNLFGDMLVQERLGGANTRIGMKPPPHRVVM